MSNKYGAVRTGGFHSKLEAAVYQVLCLRQKAGEIVEIQTQKNIHLTKAKVLYICDFACQMPDGSMLYIEAKGFEGPRWPTIKKLWRFYGPGPLEIWKGSHARPCLVDTIQSWGFD